MTLEILHVALVLLGRLTRVERSEIAALAGLWIGLFRVQPVLTGFQLADHFAPPLPTKRPSRTPVPNGPCNLRNDAILNHMVQFNPSSRFDASFAAISDATRRGVLEQLGRADASITDLAERFDMTLTGMKKHVSVLEQAGLVTTVKVGRVRTCKLGGRGLEDEAAWIERYRRMWAARFEELDKVVDQLKQKEQSSGRKANG